ncbi:MAG: iron-containing alcohol dehydrogenase [Armatimonadetes bacterium]|nr:iron-containing alcohol dehydrogenase [Armatimonadota bacterium]
MNLTFQTAKKIIFGAGCIRDIGTEAASLGKNAFLITGKTFLRRTGWLDKVLKLLEESKIKVNIFEQVPPEPTISNAQLALDSFRQSTSDIVIGIGGGSALDVAKTVAVIGRQPGTIYEYFYGRWVEQKGAPFIAIPTTAGSGSEVTPNSVLIDETERIKASIRTPLMFPDAAIVDPELTLSLSKESTAYSGMDALSQAIEAYVSKGANPITDALAKSAAVRLLTNLPKAYHNGMDVEARTEVALGSLMGGIAFANARLGLVHGLAHPIGVITGLAHGLICALLLPFVMRFNLETSTTKYANLARAARISNNTDDNKAAEALINHLEHLNSEMYIEKQLTKVILDRHYWPQIISQTLASGSAKSNPRQVTAESVEEILEIISSPNLSPN